jgi:hypothetical protein
MRKNNCYSGTVGLRENSILHQKDVHEEIFALGMRVIDFLWELAIPSLT